MPGWLVGHRHRAGQQRANHRRRTRRRQRLSAVDLDEQGHEPLVRQRAVRHFGGSAATSAASTALAGQTIKSVSVEDAAVQLAYARK